MTPTSTIRPTSLFHFSTYPLQPLCTPHRACFVCVCVLATGWCHKHTHSAAMAFVYMSSVLYVHLYIHDICPKHSRMIDAVMNIFQKMISLSMYVSLTFIHFSAYGIYNNISYRFRWVCLLLCVVYSSLIYHIRTSNTI